MSEERKCPHCGVRVYETDDVCMSCGRSLAEARPPAPEQEQPATPQPPPQPPPVTPRQPPPPSTSQMPTTARIVGSVGGFWDIFPWLALLFTILPIVLPFVGLAPSAILSQIMAMALIGFQALVGLALVFWIIVDVIEQRVGIYWIFIAIFLCYPVGFLIYLLSARE